MMGCLGVFSALTQVTLLREMLVVFYGNELTIGSILGSWLVCVGAGALAARFVVPRLSSARSVRFVLTVLLLVLAGVLLKQVSWVRSIRSMLGTGVGEYASLWAIVVSAIGICAPTCLPIGFCFPCACRVMVEDASAGAGDAGSVGIGAVSRVYAIEAVGSMVGGALMTFVLLPRLSPLQLVVLAQVAAVCGAAAVAPYRLLRGVLLAAGGVGAVIAFHFGPAMTSLEADLTAKRWQGFGVLGESAARLVTSTDSVYRNLAVVERAGQYELYGNGEIMWEFPDPLEDEHRIHSTMAQKPAAARVLLLGGNPLGDIPELLKYPVERLVYVELDAGIGRVLREVLPERYDAVFRDKRIEPVTQDGVRYVRVEADVFDAVVINSPTPSTAAANRYYTLEFFRSVRKRLAPGGFATFSVQSSVRLMDTSADYLASVYRTVREVFPTVLVTAGEENRFFVGDHDAGITFDRMVLRERSASAGVPSQYYRPEYFLATDSYDPEKTAFTVRRLEERVAELNTVSRPVSYFHNLRLWLRYSGSDARGLSRVRGFGWQRVVAVLLVCGALLCLVGRFARRRMGTVWPRAMLTGAIATTGFCGMAYELLLVFVFQGLYGYVYTRMGIIVAVFMAGLVAGARSGQSLGKSGRSAGRSLFLIEVALALFPLLVLGLVGVAARAAAAPPRRFPGTGNGDRDLPRTGWRGVDGRRRVSTCQPAVL